MPKERFLNTYQIVSQNKTKRMLPRKITKPKFLIKTVEKLK